MLHVSQRQLQSWERMGLVSAADTYSFRDLIALRAIAELRARRIPLRKIGRALESLKQRLSEVRDPLAELKIFSPTAEQNRRARGRAGEEDGSATGRTMFDFDAPNWRRCRRCRRSLLRRPASAIPKSGFRRA